MNKHHSCATCKHIDAFTEPCDTCGNNYDNWTDPGALVVAVKKPEVSNDGSTADYYVLPKGATQLQDLISYRNMNSQLGEIQRAVYRYGQGHHSSRLRDMKKIKYYAEAEIARLEKYGES